VHRQVLFFGLILIEITRIFSVDGALGGLWNIRAIHKGRTTIPKIFRRGALCREIKIRPTSRYWRSYPIVIPIASRSPHPLLCEPSTGNEIHGQRIHIMKKILLTLVYFTGETNTMRRNALANVPLGLLISGLLFAMLLSACQPIQPTVMVEAQAVTNDDQLPIAYAGDFPRLAFDTVMPTGQSVAVECQEDNADYPYAPYDWPDANATLEIRQGAGCARAPLYYLPLDL
jgi:hypothetical protein